VLLLLSGEVVNIEQRSHNAKTQTTQTLGRQLSGPHVCCASSRYLPYLLSTLVHGKVRLRWSWERLALTAIRPAFFTVDARRYRSAQTASGRLSPGTRILDICMGVDRSYGPIEGARGGDPFLLGGGALVI
jgi:hypothetical protein